MIRGTNHDQDARFTDKTKKMLEKSQWPDKYDIKIDLKKVELTITQVDYELVKVWIEKKIAKLLGEEDDIVSGTIISHLDEALEKEEKVNAKHLHVAISGVLQDKTLVFMSDLWDILDEAQRSARGIVNMKLFSLNVWWKKRKEVKICIGESWMSFSKKDIK